MNVIEIALLEIIIHFKYVVLYSIMSLLYYFSVENLEVCYINKVVITVLAFSAITHRCSSVPSLSRNNLEQHGKLI